MEVAILQKSDSLIKPWSHLATYWWGLTDVTTFFANQANLETTAFALLLQPELSLPYRTHSQVTEPLVYHVQMACGHWQDRLNVKFACRVMIARMLQQARQLFRQQDVSQHLVQNTTSEVTKVVQPVLMVTNVIMAKLWLLVQFGTMPTLRLMAIVYPVPMAIVVKVE